MHIASGFLSPPVWGTMAAVSGAALAGSLAAARRRLDDRVVPLMGVMGAFVFAAQMVNFPIIPGTTGHLGGGFLLGVLLGPWLGIVVMASVLVVQSLVFQDGGVEALGANVLTMGIVPCLLGGMVRRLWRKPLWVTRVATVLGGLVAVLVGATLVIVFFAFSGYASRLEEGKTMLYALGVMDGVHFLIGAVEGVISLVVIRFVVGTRAEAVWGVDQTPLARKAA